MEIETERTQWGLSDANVYGAYCIRRLSWWEFQTVYSQTLGPKSLTEKEKKQKNKAKLSRESSTKEKKKVLYSSHWFI